MAIRGRRGGSKGLPVLTRELNVRRTPGMAFDLEVVVERELVIHVTAAKVVERLGDAILRAIRENIQNEVVPATGEAAGVGHRTGFLSNEVRRTSIVGNENRASAQIEAPNERRGWLLKQGQSKGRYWLAMDGRVLAAAELELAAIGAQLTHPETPTNRAPKRARQA